MQDIHTRLNIECTSAMVDGASRYDTNCMTRGLGMPGPLQNKTGTFKLDVLAARDFKSWQIFLNDQISKRVD